MEIDQDSEALCFQVFRILDNEQSLETQWSWALHTIVITLYIPFLDIACSIHAYNDNNNNNIHNNNALNSACAW
jgi:hypothetical protein